MPPIRPMVFMLRDALEEEGRFSRVRLQGGFARRTFSTKSA
jgi:hypothetical protein